MGSLPKVWALLEAHAWWATVAMNGATYMQESSSWPIAWHVHCALPVLSLRSGCSCLQLHCMAMP